MLYRNHNLSDKPWYRLLKVIFISVILGGIGYQLLTTQYPRYNDWFSTYKAVCMDGRIAKADIGPHSLAYDKYYLTIYNRLDDNSLQESVEKFCGGGYVIEYQEKVKYPSYSQYFTELLVPIVFTLILCFILRAVFLYIVLGTKKKE